MMVRGVIFGPMFSNHGPWAVTGFKSATPALTRFLRSNAI